MTVRFRAPVETDAAAIAAIDAAGLAMGHASFRSEPYRWEDFEAVYAHAPGFSLVAEIGGEIAAWAGTAPVSKRAVYAGVGEISIYVSAAFQGQGVGKVLLDELARQSEKQGYWTLAASVFPENDASLALHRSCGFREVGIRERIGRMGYGPLKGAWRNTILLERRSTITGID